MPLPDRIRLPLNFDPARLITDLERLESGEWINHFVTRNYEGDWSVIPLRGPAGAEHPVMMIYSDPTCEDFADTPFLETCPYFKEVLASLESDLRAVRLMRLGPGARIKEHCDHDLSVEDGTVRLHVPIRTHEDVEFVLNGERIMMRSGECWYLRLSDPHSVFNPSPIARVHLVIDAPVTPRILELLAKPSSQADPP